MRPEFADAPIDGVNAAVLCSKLLQYASGFVYDENGAPAASTMRSS